MVGQGRERLLTRIAAMESVLLSTPMKSWPGSWSWKERSVFTYWQNNADNNRSVRERFVVHADEKLTAFVIRHSISDQKITAPHTPQVWEAAVPPRTISSQRQNRAAYNIFIRKYLYGNEATKFRDQPSRFTMWRLFVLPRSPLFEIAPMLVRFDHGAGFVINANHSIMWTAVVHRVSDCIRDDASKKCPNFAKIYGAEVIELMQRLD
jgi:hypothetical protein